MHQQSDLFDTNPSREMTAAPAAVVESNPPPLAAPCGFLNCRNQPCRRSTSRPLLLEGAQFVHRGIPLLLCDPLCWRDVDPTTAIADTAQDDPLADRIDHDDPGPDGLPEYDEWAGWERADDDGFGAVDRGGEDAEKEGRGAFRLMGGTGL